MRLSKKEKLEFKSESLAYLREIIKPGSMVYTINVHTSRSGMMRHIKAFVVNEGALIDISGHISNILGWSRANNGGVKVSGCGMDIGFHLTYYLGRALFPEGGPLNWTSYARRIQAEKAGTDKEVDGGYLLQQMWL